MKPQSPPTKLARFTEFGTGRTNWSYSCNMESNRRRNGSPPVELELELELGTGYSKKSCGFTIFQLQELQLQSLIYKYMEAGLAVPCQLVIPIWKSVANSVTGLQQIYPSFYGSGSVHLELRKGIMDTEPGRCRRTDGKKWRCSKEAIPDHKYCERHVHRGRLRSRKLVEASRLNSLTTNNTNATANTNLSISPPAVNSRVRASLNFGFSPRSVLHGGNKKT